MWPGDGQRHPRVVDEARHLEQRLLHVEGPGRLEDLHRGVGQAELPHHPEGHGVRDGPPVGAGQGVGALGQLGVLEAVFTPLHGR